MKKNMFRFYLILFFPLSIFADKVFEIDEEKYHFLDDLSNSIEPKNDKGSVYHDYTRIYSHYFDSIRERNLTILEIGIYEGASVKLWESYFPNADLHFIDITFKKVQYFSERSKYYLADQEDAAQLINVVQKIGEPIDIIFDDGGHMMNQQINSFITLWPYLKSGGIYVVEDLHTSYWKEYKGTGTRKNPVAGSGTMVQFLKNLVDDVNFIGARTSSASHEKDLTSIKNELNDYRTEILGIHFYDSLGFIIKK